MVAALTSLACLLSSHYVSPFRPSETPGGHTSNIYNVYMCTDGAENRTKLPSLTMFHSVWQYTVFLQSDAVVTIYFAAHFVQLLFEGSAYLFFSVIRNHLHTFVRVAFTTCGYYLRAVFISFKSFRFCGYYSREVTIQGRCLLIQRNTVVQRYI